MDWRKCFFRSGKLWKKVLLEFYSIYFQKRINWNDGEIFKFFQQYYFSLCQTLISNLVWLSAEEEVGKVVKGCSCRKGLKDAFASSQFYMLPKIASNACTFNSKYIHPFLCHHHNLTLRYSIFRCLTKKKVNATPKNWMSYVAHECTNLLTRISLDTIFFTTREDNFTFLLYWDTHLFLLAIKYVDVKKQQWRMTGVK